MKATIQHEATIYTLTAGGKVFPGYKQVGAMAGLKHLVGTHNGEEAIVMVGGDKGSGMAHAFRQLLDTSNEVIVIAASGRLAKAMDANHSGLRAVAVERERQVAVEGWTQEHDDEHDKGELASAALCYTIAATLKAGELAEMITGGWSNTPADIKSTWPWEPEWWKPGTPQRMLEKAAALLIAERERIDRKEAFENARPRGDAP